MAEDGLMWNSNSHSVANVIWRGADVVEPGELASAVDPAAFLAPLRGQFALHERTGFGEHRLARDPLGVNKLFFAVCDDGEVESSNWLIDLLRAGYSARDVYSVPSGHCISLRPAQQKLELTKFSDLRWSSMEGKPLGSIAKCIRADLDSAFDSICDRIAGRDVWVTLSGGLDSSLVAVLAKERVANLRAITFHVGDNDDDLLAARRVADELGLPLSEIRIEPNELASRVDSVLLYGQDWRDFNVHCGLVNEVLAEEVASLASEGTRPVVLTGDTMNELAADYSPVEVDGASHYGLPKMAPSRLRRFLVGGLDAGDREVGIFSRHGVDVIQPFAICASAYAALPGEYVSSADAKSKLVRAVMGTRVPEFVHQRPKVRAQVGNEDGRGGVLGALLDQGVDQDYLANRFKELFGLRDEDQSNLIRAGFYRFTSTYPIAS